MRLSSPSVHLVPHVPSSPPVFLCSSLLSSLTIVSPPHVDTAGNTWGIGGTPAIDRSLSVIFAASDGALYSLDLATGVSPSLPVSLSRPVCVSLSPPVSCSPFFSLSVSACLSLFLHLPLSGSLSQYKPPSVTVSLCPLCLPFVASYASLFYFSFSPTAIWCSFDSIRPESRCGCVQDMCLLAS